MVLAFPELIEEAWQRLANRGGSEDDVRRIVPFLAKLWELDPSDPRAFDDWLERKSLPKKKDLPLFILAGHKKDFDAEQHAKVDRTRGLIEGLTLGPWSAEFLTSFGAFCSALKGFAFRTAISVGRNEQLLFIFSALTEEDKRLAQEWVRDLPVSPLQRTLTAYFKNSRVPLAIQEGPAIAPDSGASAVERLLRYASLPPERLRKELQDSSKSEIEALVALAEGLLQRLPERKFGRFIKLNLAVYVCIAAPNSASVPVAAQALISTNEPAVAEILASLGKTWLRDELARSQGVPLSGRERFVAALMDVCRTHYSDSLAYFEGEIKSLAKAAPRVLVVAARAILISLHQKDEKRFETLLVEALRNDKSQQVSEWLVRNPDFVRHIRVDKTPIKTIEGVLGSCLVHQPVLARKLAERILAEAAFPAQLKYWQEALWALAKIGDAESDAVFNSFVMLRQRNGQNDQLTDLLMDEPANSLLKKNFWTLVSGTDNVDHWNFLFRAYRARVAEAALLNFLEVGYERGGAVATWILAQLIPAMSRDETVSPTFPRAISNTTFLIEIAKNIARDAVTNADFLRSFAGQWDSARVSFKRRLLRGVGCGLRVALQNSTAETQMHHRLVSLSQAIEDWGAGDSPRLDPTLRSRASSTPTPAIVPSKARVESFFQGQLRSQAEFTLFAGSNPWAIDFLFGSERGAWPKPEFVVEQIIRTSVVEAGLRARAESELANLPRTLRVELGVILRETLQEIESDMAGYFAFRDILGDSGFEPVMPRLGGQVKQTELTSQRHKLVRDSNRRGRLRAFSLGLQVEDVVVGSGLVMNSGDDDDRD